jgi:G3E family GTPase
MIIVYSTPMPVPPVQLPVTLLGGFAPAVRDAVAGVWLATTPGVVLIEHDLSRLHTEGLVRRTVRDGLTVIEDETIALDHGCISCALREDVLPTLLRLARSGRWNHVVLALPQVVEHDAVVAVLEDAVVEGVSIADHVRVDGVVCVVDARTVIADLENEDDLQRRGIAAAEEDGRGVGEVVARQIEAADQILVGHLDTDDEVLGGRVCVLLEHLNPAADQVALSTMAIEAAGLLDRGRHDPATYFQRWEPGHLMPPACTCACGVETLVWRSRRPFHPQRLHDALGELVGPTIRSRGHLWLASRPSTLLVWDTVGDAVSIAPATRWLVDAPDDAWTVVSPLRRTLASMNWDPYYGDREHALAFTGIDMEPEALERLLGECLLTDDELALGESAWREWPDPFTPYLGDEQEFLDSLSLAG